MSDTPETSPEKPKKKIITVGADRISSDSSGGGERRGGKGRRGGRGRDDGDRKPATPPALMRGPKPKPKSVVEELPEAVAPEAVAEDAAAEAEPTEVTPEAAETAAETSPA